MPHQLVMNPPAFQTDLKRLIESYRLDNVKERVRAIMSAIRDQSPDTAMTTIDKTLDTNGVEALRFGGDSDSEPDYLYANTGDTYAATVVYDVKNNRFFVADYGTLVEEAEQGKRGGHHRRYARKTLPKSRASRATSEAPAGGLAENDQLLQQLVEMSAESMEATNPKDAEVTKEVERVAAEYDRALWAALNEMVRRYPPKKRQRSSSHYSDPEPGRFDASDLWNAEAPFLVLMTLQEQGVGIWDGNWEDFYPSEMLDKEIDEFLKAKLGKFSSGSGSGKLEEAFMNAAYETTNIPEEGR